MAELVPIPFPNLLRRMYHEYRTCKAMFDLPVRKFYSPSTAVDMSVMFCGNRAANPSGPAAGPQTQLAQNMVLSWLAGARILELKTVQINDRLQISRPCIDTRTVGYNVEWSQELLLDQSLREYVKGSMIIEILKKLITAGEVRFGEERLDERIDDANLDTIYDISVGYDLAGITSQEIRNWLGSMRDASVVIEEYRRQIPPEFRHLRDLPFKTEIANSITLSTFHGTPAEDIERICGFLLAEMDFHVVIKMNPPMLGKDRLEHILQNRLGYTSTTINNKVFDLNISFDDAVQVVRRLQTVASSAGRTIGVKFGNTLEVLNNGSFFKDAVQYLAGPPLHVVHLALVYEWRKVFGAEFPISFAAGVDANNFADCVGIGLVPVTTCTDLLRPGGYGRLRQYLLNLEHKMNLCGANDIPSFIIRSEGDGRSSAPQDALLNATGRLLEKSLENPRYHASNNKKTPRKIGSHLEFWDCINCDKCIPVCPNDANFYFEIEPVEILYKNIEINEHHWRDIPGGIFRVEESHQIATFADACNECGNCDVFCPEDGGPYIEKPRFFGSVESFRKWNNLSGFVFITEHQDYRLLGRFKDREFGLTFFPREQRAKFEAGDAILSLDWKSHNILDAECHRSGDGEIVDLAYYFAMMTLMKGMLDRHRVHFINIEVL